MVRVGCRQMDDISNQKILRTFFDGKIGCVELDEYWMPKLEKFCEVAGSLGFKSNESPQAMKVDQIKYHCMVHIPTEEIYAVAGVEYMPQYKEGYYRVWTRLSRIPNENIPITKMVRYGRDMKCLNLMVYYILIASGQMSRKILRQRLEQH